MFRGSSDKVFDLDWLTCSAAGSLTGKAREFWFDVKYPVSLTAKRLASVSLMLMGHQRHVTLEQQSPQSILQQPLAPGEFKS